MSDDAILQGAGTEPLVPPTRDDAYRWKLLRLLASATFFEGYDNFVLSFVLALILADLGGTEAQAGWIRAIVGFGAVVAFGLSAQADRIGRKKLEPASGCRSSLPREGHVSRRWRRSHGWGPSSSPGSSSLPRSD